MLSALLVCAGGCASTQPGADGDPHAACREELRQAQANSESQLAERDNALKIVRDEFELLERKTARLNRELQAAHETANSQEQAKDAALTLVRERDEQIAKLRKSLQAASSAPTGEMDGAVKLLRQKDEQIKALRDELAFAKAGGKHEVPPEVRGGVQVADLNLDTPVAMVDGMPLTRRGFVEFLYRDMASPQLLELYINRQLILEEARRRSLEVSDLDAQVWVEHQFVDQAQSAGSAEALDERLAESGYTRDAWMSRLRYQSRPAVLLQRMVAQERTTPEGAVAWEARLRQAYQQDYGETVSGSHILFRLPPEATPAQVQAVQAKAERVYRQLENGLSFAEAARRSSDDRDTARMGGYIGEFGRQRFAELPRLNTAFFSTEVGKPTRPIRSKAGFHIVLVEKRSPPPLSFQQARPKLEQRLRDEQPSPEEMQALIDRLRKRSTIQRTLKFTDDDE